ncbi:mast cell protease 1A-like [Anguilla anguilla]|uniref:mast cell protease 1A-like n=1 Tax=Anguilla anguilla TaxID=7936 RepID=UPI0015AC5FD5|nr:mast cell protease 1A-like [Anguilla anguilla]
MSAPLLTPLVVGLLIALGQAAQQDSGIVNGREAQPHSRPYMVSVQERNKHICGGFLVSRSFVMTAAHCWTKDGMTVLLGAHDISEKRKSIRAEVAGYRIHPGYNDYTLENDIMLLKLKTVVQKTKEVKWISLPEKDEDIQPNKLCSVAGWGAIKSNGATSPRLQEVDVSVVDRAECQERWGNKPITPRMMCAGGSADKRGFCQRDSGGPLVCSGLAVGIVSFNYNYNCTYPNLPNVYTQISKFLPWIEKYINNTSLSFLKR